MDKHLREQLGKWISEYIDVNEGISYEHEMVITRGIKLLLSEGDFDIDSMRKDILKKAYVLLPYDFFKECLELESEVQNG